MQNEQHVFTNLRIQNFNDYAAVGKAFFDRASYVVPGSVYGQSAIIALNFRLNNQFKDEPELSKYGYALAQDSEKILDSVNKGVSAHRASGKGEPATTPEDMEAIIELTPDIVKTDFLMAEAFRMFPLEINNQILQQFFEFVQPLRLRLHKVNYDLRQKNKIAAEHGFIIPPDLDLTPAVISENIYQGKMSRLIAPQVMKLGYDNAMKVLDLLSEAVRIGRRNRSEI